MRNEGDSKSWLARGCNANLDPLHKIQNAFARISTPRPMRLKGEELPNSGNSVNQGAGLSNQITPLRWVQNPVPRMIDEGCPNVQGCDELPALVADEPACPLSDGSADEASPHA